MCNNDQFPDTKRAPLGQILSGIEPAERALEEGHVGLSLSKKLERIARKQVLVLAAILFVGAALRIYGLDSELWYDEIATWEERLRRFPAEGSSRDDRSERVRVWTP